jgi:hypothetical protein
MYNPAFQTVIADARIEDLRRARATSRQPHRDREDNDPRPAARWGLLSHAGVEGLSSAADRDCPLGRLVPTPTSDRRRRHRRAHPCGGSKRRCRVTS